MEFGVSQASTVRRMLFATSFLPPDIPNYWEMVATFASDGSVSPQQAKLKMENVQMLDSEALCSDVNLTKELMAMEYRAGQPGTRSTSCTKADHVSEVSWKSTATQ